jgi:hypothetical protein
MVPLVDAGESDKTRVSHDALEDPVCQEGRRSFWIGADGVCSDTPVQTLSIALGRPSQYVREPSTDLEPLRLLVAIASCGRVLSVSSPDEIPRVCLAFLDVILTRIRYKAL